MIPVPFLIGAAVAGGIAYALSDDDKKSDGQWVVEKTTRRIPEKELPPHVRKKIRHGAAEADVTMELIEAALGEGTAHRILSENQLPHYAKKKLAEKRNK